MLSYPRTCSHGVPDSGWSRNMLSAVLLASWQHIEQYQTRVAVALQMAGLQSIV